MDYAAGAAGAQAGGDLIVITVRFLFLLTCTPILIPTAIALLVAAVNVQSPLPG